MRQIHGINLRLRTYFKPHFVRSESHELFIDPNEDNDITTQNPSQGEVCPTAEELAQIEEQLEEGKI